MAGERIRFVEDNDENMKLFGDGLATGSRRSGRPQAKTPSKYHPVYGALRANVGALKGISLAPSREATLRGV